MNLEFNGAIDWFHPSGSFIIRPSVTGPDGSISGIALRQENYFMETATVNTVNTSLSIATSLQADFDTFAFPVPVTRRSRLHPSFAVAATHTTASAPSEWIIRFNKNNVAVASGWFRWDATTGVENTWGTWETDTDGVIFDVFNGAESADYWSMQIDNNGSGTLIDAPVVRIQIGFTVQDNDPDV
jgi:hypothetical protein